MITLEAHKGEAYTQEANKLLQISHHKVSWKKQKHHNELVGQPK